MVTRALALVLTLVAAGAALAATPARGPRGCFGAALPTVRAVGTVASGTAAISPGLPSGTVAGDLLLMFCENSGEGAQTASGWTQLIDVTGTTGTRLTILWKWAIGSDATTTNDVGDHQLCRIVGVTINTPCWLTPSIGTLTGSNNQTTTTTAVSITGVTTTINNSLVFMASAGDLPDAAGTAQFSCTAPCGSNLGSVTERVDNTVTAGNGGALYVASGTLATAGATGTLGVTATTTAVRANAVVTIAGR